MKSFPGGYPVGTVDVAFSTIANLRTLAAVIPEQHIVGRLFYPCQALGPHSKGPKSTWMPSYEYAQGFTEFMFQRKTGYLAAVAKAIVKRMAWWVGKIALPLNVGAPMATSEAKFPIVILSHGMSGTRTVSSLICGSLASQGIAVFAVEHTDGTAATTALASSNDPKPCFQYYSGWRTTDERDHQIAHRMAENRTALRVVQHLAHGSHLEGLRVTGGLDPATAFTGIDAECVGLVGHSFGALTVAAQVAEDADFACAVAWDPWWGQIPPESPARTAWQTDSPLLILGSHAWNVPDDKGRIYCDGKGQSLVMHSSTLREGQEPGSGPGSVLAVIHGSSHDTAVDVRALFNSKIGWLLKRLVPRKETTGGPDLAPDLGIKLTADSTHAFLLRHLPTTPQQQQMLQTAMHRPTDQSTERVGKRQADPSHSIQISAEPSSSATEKKQQDLSGEGVSSGTPGLIASAQTAGKDNRQAPSRVGQADRSELERILTGRIFKLELAHEIEASGSSLSGATTSG
ncbi:hypothetical protein WJX73_003281 [Symbiochloris irregularis]|uniref:1-alkyl-2-acetylglycerophosphocholine esterase n=1 Tax=Symbiochloris irregularis TaxID=706552 RepID=A0AAW1P1Q7_9CHLO